MSAMAQHEISQGQIRGLLLLLVLGPLIPTALMLRLMFESVRAARSETRDRIAEMYQQSLATAVNSLNRQWESAPPRRNEAPEKIAAHFRSVFDPSVSVRLADEHGATLAGGNATRDEPLATTELGSLFPGWRLELRLLGRSAVIDSTEEQISVFLWTAGIAVAANLVIAAAAGCALHRQMKLQELNNSSLANVSHELRTPLASMRVLLETLRDGRYRDEEQLRDYLDLAVRENSRLGRLIENFLTLSRIERGTHVFNNEPVAPGEIVHAALDALNLKTDTGEIEYAPGENLPPIPADRDALTMALVNLLENAVKYTGEKKRIVIGTRLDGSSVVFSVGDNGIGIDRTEQSKIFRRFYQVDQKLTRASGGCGLGLSIVKQIADAHGGTVSVESELGKGSRFFVSIPAT
jgi:signal transduction histidine kinase